jgi:cytochrome bd-type quinol oxidase subunit 2
MGLDYRHKVDNDTWRKRWDLAITGGSFLAALLWGVGLTNIVYGTPIKPNPAVRRATTSSTATSSPCSARCRCSAG